MGVDVCEVGGSIDQAECSLYHCWWVVVQDGG
jgi:hypothetical protein